MGWNHPTHSFFLNKTNFDKQKYIHNNPPASNMTPEGLCELCFIFVD